VVCAFCGASVMHDRWMAHRRDFARALEGERLAAAAAGGDQVQVGAHSYSVIKQLAQGESSDVLLAARTDGAPERVVLKLLRDADAAARFEQSCAAISSLGGAMVLGRRVPRLRHQGRGTRNGVALDTAVFSYESGFFQTLWDVREVHGAALDPAHAVWIWRRILDVLAATHAAGCVHRALVPHHLVVHPRDHGILVVGWGASASSTAKINGVVEPFASLYPEGVVDGEPFTPAHDLAMSARTMGWLLRDDDSWHPGRATPAPLGELIVSVGSGGSGTPDARALDLELKERAAQAFGAPRYRRLDMPGWQ